MAPAVPVTVTWYVAALDPEPPHPTIVERDRTVNARASRACQNPLFFWRCSSVNDNNPAPPKNASIVVPLDAEGWFGIANWYDAAEAVFVLMVNVDVAALLPSSVTDAGLKLHEAFLGRPEHVKLTC